jgi:phospholipase/carboxylesterase
VVKTETHQISGIEGLSVTSERSETAVVFLHGYGANMHDLFPLWQLWHRDGFNWYFPNGILPLPMGYYGGRSWFSIDIEALELAMRTGTHRNMSGHLPPELEDTLVKLENYLTEIAARHERVILGGFSQGAMLTSHLAMRQSLKLDALILLSGALVAQERFPQKARGIPFFQSHGAQDPVLSLEGARDLEQKLQTLNFVGKLEVFQGGHEIPPPIISGVKSFLDKVI